MKKSTAQTQTEGAKALLSRREVAAFAGIHEDTVARLEQSKQLPGVRVGRIVRYRREDVERFFSPEAKILNQTK